MTGEDWTFDSEPKEDVLKFSESPAPEIVLSIPADKPYTVELFGGGTKVGTLDMSTGVLKFEGIVDESAAALFTQLKKLADTYIEDQLGRTSN